MIFWPILGLFVIAAGYVIRNNFDFPDNKNLDGMVNMAGWGVKVAGLLLFIISTFNGMFFTPSPALNTMSGLFWAKKNGLGYRIKHAFVWPLQCMEKCGVRSSSKGR